MTFLSYRTNNCLGGKLSQDVILIHETRRFSGRGEKNVASTGWVKNTPMLGTNQIKPCFGMAFEEVLSSAKVRFKR